MYFSCLQLLVSYSQFLVKQDLNLTFSADFSCREPAENVLFIKNLTKKHVGDS